MKRVVDLFAGCGGSSEGARQAGAQVLAAANHWPDAVRTHELNHPDALHVCQDLQQADWREFPEHDILWASPACQGHSRARGAEQKHHDVTRSTAWAVVSCTEAHLPGHVIVENVPEFQEWSLYRAWTIAMQDLGYELTSKVIDSADCGVPQNRRRLYIVASRDGFEIQQPTHEHVPARSFVDLHRGNWTPVADKVEATRTRVKNGLDRFSADDAFLVPYYGSGSGTTGRSLDRPLGTLRTRDCWAIVRDQGREMRFLDVEECRAAMGFPEGYQLPRQKTRAKFMLGNAVTPPVARELITQVSA